MPLRIEGPMFETAGKRLLADIDVTAGRAGVTTFVGPNGGSSIRTG